MEWSGIREGREGKVKGEEERGKRRGSKGEKGGRGEGGRIGTEGGAKKPTHSWSVIM